MSRKLNLAFIGQAEYNQPLYETDLDDLYQVTRFQTTFDLSVPYLATASSMASLIDLQPDVSIFFRPEYFSNDLLLSLHGLKIGISTEPLPKYIQDTFHFTTDFIRRFRSLLEAADRQFDYIFHYDSSSLSFMERMGVRVSAPLELPVATKTWNKSDGRQTSWDVVFVGRSTAHRESYFGPLKRDFRFLHVAHGIIGKDCLPYYQASKIGLNIHSEPELAWEPRVQQLMAAGLLVVSEAISPNDVLFPNEHFVEVHNGSAAYDACRDILFNPGKFEGIRCAGYERVATKLSARHVWPQLVDRCLEHAFPRATFDLSRVRLAPLEICSEFNGFEHLLDQLRGEHV